MLDLQPKPHIKSICPKSRAIIMGFKGVATGHQYLILYVFGSELNRLSRKGWTYSRSQTLKVSLKSRVINMVYKG